LGAGRGAAEEVEERHGEDAEDEPSAGGSGDETAMVFAGWPLVVGIQWLVPCSPHL